MIVSSARVDRMKIIVLVANRAMISSVFGAIVKTFPVGPPVRSVELAVNSCVRPVIALVLARMRVRGWHR